MRIVLVPHLGYSYAKQKFEAYAPLGLLSLYSVLKERGYEVEIIDLTMMIEQHELHYDEDLYVKSARTILKRAPDIIGLGTICDTYLDTLKIAREIKRMAPQVVLVLGGAHATLACKDTLRTYPDIDFICLGESERSFPRLITSIQDGHGYNNVEGIAFMREGEFLRTSSSPMVANLDELPLIDYDFYGDLIASREAPLESSRGCFHKCAFCAARVLWQGVVRSKSARRVEKEIRLLQNRYGVKRAAFIDDLFGADKSRLSDICSRMPRGKNKISWRCITRLDCLSDDEIKMMKDAGCYQVSFGIESGSRRIQKLIRKKISLNKARKGVSSASKAGIIVNVLIIYGFPFETSEELAVMLNLLIDYARMENINVITPQLKAFCGTEIFSKYGDSLSFDEEAIPWGIAGLYKKGDAHLVKTQKSLFSSYYNFGNTNIYKSNKSALVALFASHIMVVSKYRPEILNHLRDHYGDALSFYNSWCAWLEKCEPRPQEYRRRVALDRFEDEAVLSDFNTFLDSEGLSALRCSMD